ncbi:glycosyltransferase family 2 protein [Gaiella sp.]|jgi:glycosyltransferase involved in cell wall biosynthesis|uniref:glycosyltransferase family 2 protein n=1 Tax=Gaiella sp. TaxID=2663207 RepID=UPI002C165FE6|nr:glycosyltransferase family 2 protein [Gaiella sp.]HWO81770.1 glycosyltransferase family 2 protein [Gaiella sp.]
MSAAAPEISVVIPCLNEEEAVGAVVDQAWEGISASGRPGEVIVVDNRSTDRSAEVAADHGAIVVREERPGYGSAYLAGLAVARGDYIVMGDADETYPIRDLAPFVARLAAGDDLVMGSRFEGTIHGEAMPWLNRHVGNPILTGLLNVLFGVKISDAHCGMRAVRREALETLDLHSTGMEFASEMVFKAFRRKLRVSEIPIDYYPRVGESKLNRFGDAWRHVRFMLLYSPSWLYFVPGAILLVIGVLGAIALAAGPVTVLGHTWQIHSLFLCMFAILLGTQVVQLGIFARAFAYAHLGETDALVERARERLRLEHGLAAGGVLLLAGVVTLFVIFVAWAFDGFGALSHEYATALGFTAVAVGTQVVLGSFFLGLLTMRTTEPSRAVIVERVPVA